MERKIEFWYEQGKEVMKVINKGKTCPPTTESVVISGKVFRGDLDSGLDYITKMYIKAEKQIPMEFVEDFDKYNEDFGKHFYAFLLGMHGKDE